MKIAVLGSIFSESDSSRQEQFRDACRSLGAEAARRGHSMILCSANPHTADRSCVEGAASVDRTNDIIVIRSQYDEEAAPFANEQSELPSINFTFTRCDGHWPVVHLDAMAKADVVLIIGGGDSANTAGHSARILRKPVFAIPAFGGAGRDLWPKFVDMYTRAEITEQELGLVRETWNSQSAETAISMAEKLAKNHPYKESSVIQNIAIFVIVGLVIGLWIACFVQIIDWDNRILLFVMLVLSGLLGTGLRMALRISQGSQPEIEPTLVANEATIGMIIGFALTLFYFTGEFVVTGAIGASIKDEDFTRVAVSMSIIGFAGAFAFEAATKKLSVAIKEKLSI